MNGIRHFYAKGLHFKSRRHFLTERSGFELNDD
jgi:hypothetical protein